MDLQSADLSTFILLAGAGALALAGLAFFAGRLHVLRRSGARAADPLLREEAAEEDSRELRKSVWLLQNESRNLHTFLTILPDFARALNSTLEKRRIAPLLIRMIEQIFDPQQILIFFTTQEHDGLIVVEEKGLAREFDRSQVVRFGEGRIGWVASHQITMDDADFLQRARFVKADFDPNTEPHFKVELASPMAHKDRTFGVISVGGMLRHPKNEKTMLRMVADLGSIALNNSFLFHQMEQLVNSDGLTGLCTKRFFLTRLAEKLVDAESNHEEFALFIFDIDHFKHYNDTNGHLAGDECLKLTGRLLRQSIRDDDVAARYGGEEFIVLLPNTPKHGAMVLAEKVRAAIQGHPFPREAGQPMGDLTISGGVAAFPFDGKTSAELIRAADEALYAAKRSGRNRVEAYQPTYLSEAEDTGSSIAAVGKRT